MLDINHIFQDKVADSQKLIDHGFTQIDNIYQKEEIILDTFKAIIAINQNSKVHFNLYDIETKEEYVLIHIANSSGKFVEKVRHACEETLREIANTCFLEPLQNEKQANRMIDFIKTQYAIDPEYLWKKHPNYAVFRNPTNQKWFGIMMVIEKKKLGLSQEGHMTIINLKEKPEQIEERINQTTYFPAYHMNKKHWFSICLDGGIGDEEIKNHIQRSYGLTNVRK